MWFTFEVCPFTGHKRPVILFYFFITSYCFTWAARWFSGIEMVTVHHDLEWNSDRVSADCDQKPWCCTRYSNAQTGRISSLGLQAWLRQVRTPLTNLLHCRVLHSFKLTVDITVTRLVMQVLLHIPNYSHLSFKWIYFLIVGVNKFDANLHFDLWLSSPTPNSCRLPFGNLPIPCQKYNSMIILFIRRIN